MSRTHTSPNARSTRAPHAARKRQPLRIALEPRMMFDGAAIATAVAQLFPAADAAVHDTSGTSGTGADGHDAQGATAAHTALGEALAALPLAEPAGGAAAHAVVFIDSSLAQRDELLAAVPAGAQVVLLDAHADGLQQISDALAGQSGIDAIHLITHGNSGSLQLGTTVLDASAIALDRGGLLAEIGKHLSADADVLVYGCDFGAGEQGAAATDALAHALGADVATSDDATGAAAMQGDWDLERHAGAIQTAAISAQDWDGLLIGLNTPPVALPDVLLVNANSSATINVIANDIDLQGDTITVVGANALSGTVVVNANSSLTYTPTPGYAGVDVITYTIRDSHGANALLAGTVAVTVNALPTLALPTLSLFTEDTPIVFASVLGTQLTVGDIDGNIANLSLSVPSGSLSLATTAGLSLSQGTGSNDQNVTIQGSIASVNAALNGLVYTPAADYNGAVTLTIGLTDTLLGLPITILLPLNIAAVADIAADSVSTTLGQAVSFNVLANDSFENSGRVVSSYGTPSHGTVSINAQGNASYTPTAGYTGTDTFTYTVSSNGTTETASITVTIGTPPNHAPTAGVLGNLSANDAQTVSFNVASAFADVDGDTLTYSASGLPSGLSINTTSGVISGQINGHASVAVAGGAYTVVVSANDGQGGSVNQSFVLTVANPAPTAVADGGIGINTASISGNVLNNDSDADGDSLSISTVPVVAPSHGSVVLQANGGYLYTPALAYVGFDSFTYRVTDADGGSSTASVSLLIAAPLNQLPVAVADTAFVNENGSVVVNVLGNDTDPDGDALSITSASALHGSVTTNPNGSLSYTPNLNFSGPDLITYRIRDAQGGDALLAGTVAVTVNAAPTITLPTLPVLYEDTPIVFASVLGTRLSLGDIDGSIAQLTLSVPAGGLSLAQTAGLTLSQGTGSNDSTVTVQGSIVDINAALNGLVYTPAADYNGPVTLTLTLNDGFLNIPITAQLPLNITAVADIVADSVSTLVGQAASFNVLANDSFENSGRVVSGHTAPSHGTVSIDAQGNASYTPTGGYVGSDSFTYTVTSNGTVETATVSITVGTPPNQAPTAGVLGNVSANDAQTLSINVSGAFADADGDTLSYSAVGLPAGLSLNAGTGVVSGTVDGHASVAVAGGVYTVVVTASDGRGGSVDRSFQITVGNPAPTAVADSASLAEDGSAGGNVLANDSDVDGDTLTVSTTPVVAPAHGTLVLNADGSYVYTPQANYHGSDSFTYRVTDADGGSTTAVVTLTISSVNDAPTSTPLVDRSNTVGTSVSVNESVYFSDVDGDTLLFTATGLPPGLLLNTSTGVISGTLLLAGTYSVTLTATDTGGLSTQQSFTWTTTAVPNNAPNTVGTLPANNSNDGAAVLVSTAGGFSDPDGDTLSYGASGLPAGLSINVITGIVSGTLAANASSAVPGGVYTIVVTASDGRGGSASQGFTLTAANPSPIANNDIGLGSEDGTISGNVRVNDSDPDGDTLSVSTTPVVAPAHGSLVLNADGSYVYTAFANFSGSDSFTYQLTDSDGGTAIGVVSLSVAAVNDAPTSTPLANQSNTVGASVTLDESSHFADVDGDALTYTAIGLPPGLTVNASTGVISGSLLLQGTYAVTLTAIDTGGLSTSQSFTWTAVPVPNNGPNTVGSLPANNSNDGAAVLVSTSGGFSDPDGDTLSYSASGLPAGLSINAVTGVVSGTLAANTSSAVPGGVYTIVVTANDGRGGSASQGFTLTATNPAPVANSDIGLGTEDGTISGNVLTNDIDPDGDTLAVSTTPVVAPAHGTLVLNADGSYVYTPHANFSGSDSFTYQLSDSDGSTTTGVVTLTVLAVNDAPTSTPLADQSNTVGASVTVNEAPFFADVDGDALIYTAIGLPPGLTVNASTGVISGSLLTVGTYSVTLTATDTGALSTSQSFTWTAVPVPNNAPNTVGSLVAGSGNDGAVVAVGTSGGFSDPDGDVLSYSASGLPAGLSINAITGVISGTLAANASSAVAGGVYTVIVTVNDGRGGMASQGFTFTASNPVPLASVDSGIGLEDGSISGNVLGNDIDPDGDALSVSTTPVVAPAHGSLVLNADGSYVYTPDANYFGSDSFTYRLIDADGGTTTAVVSLSVAAVNDAPTSTPLGDRSNTVGTSVTVSEASHFSDVDGDALAYTAIGLPPGLTVDVGTGVISGTLLTAGTYSVTLTATDAGGLSTSQSFNWTTAAAPNNGPNTVGSLPANHANDGAVVLVSTSGGFSDPDGDLLTYSAAGLPAGLSINTITGVISGTLASNASTAAAGGVYTIVVTADDGRGGTASQGFTLTAANLTPVAHNDSGVGVEDGSISGNVLANDVDPDGDALSVGVPAVIAPAHGTLVLNADGSYVYTPDANFAGADSFTYRVTDADGGTSTAVVVLNVVAVNDAPTSTALPDRVNSVGATVSVNETAHFSDVDGDSLVYTALGLPPGLAVDAGSGVISGTVLAAGTYSVTLTATDGGGLSTSQVFTWTTAAMANNGPNTVSTLPANSAIDGAVIAVGTSGGFSDADGDTLSYGATGLPAGVSIDTITGIISGTLAANASSAVPGGVYTVIVTANDGRGGTASQGFTLTAANPGPTAGNDFASGTEDGTLGGNVLVNDIDPDGDTLSVSTTPVLAPAHGSLVLNADGSFVYTPDADYAGSDSFTYQLTDADGGTSSGVVNLTVLAVNDPPTSTPLADQNNTVGASVTLNESAHFSDVDGDALVFSATGLPPGLTVDAGSGVISGSLLTAGTYSVTVTATDTGGLSTSQTFTWTAVAAPNNAPNTVGSLPVSTANDGSAVLLGTSSSFQDPDGDALSYSASGLPAGLGIDATSGVISGSLAANASAAVPGGVYTIVVTASDGRGGSASQGFTLTAANLAPVAGNDSGAGLEDGSISGNLLFNDSDPDGDTLVVSTTPVVAPAHGSLVLNADGSYVYTPDANFFGTDFFTYQLTDSDGSSSTGVASLSVAAVNDAPLSTALDDRSNTVGTSVTVNESAHFADVDGDALIFTATGLPPGLGMDAGSGVISGSLLSAGTYSVTVTATDAGGLSTSQSFTWTTLATPNNGPNSVGAVPATSANDGSAVLLGTAGSFQDPDGDVLSYSASGLPAGLSIDAATGVISGSLAANASSAVAGGVYTVIVTASDGRGGKASQGFTLTAANPAPSANNDAFVVAEDGSISGNVLANDVDVDGDALHIGLPPVVAPAHGTLVLNADGSYVYTPDANFAGSDSFTYRVTDADGGTATAVVTLTVLPVNDAPTSTPLADQNNTVGATVTLNEVTHFSDVDGDALVFSATGLPPGLAVNAGTGVISGSLLTAGTYSVTLVATDGGGLSTRQSFTWTAVPTPNNGPNTVGSLPASNANDGSAVLLGTSGSFQDADGDVLSYSARGLPAGVNIDAATGVISGSLAANASTATPGGVYTVIVTASDGRGGMASQGFTLTAANVGPTAGNDAAVGTEDGSISGNVLTNDVDTDGDAMTVATTPVVAPAHGSLVLNADGSYRYTPDANYAGSDSFSYRVTDADGSSSVAVVDLSVVAVNDAPISSPIDARSNSVGTSVTVNESAHFADVDGDALRFSATGLPPGLTLDASSGAISGSLLVAGTYAVTLTATDSGGLSTRQTFTWTAVAAPNNSPNSAGSLPASTANDGSAVLLATSGGFSDADGDTLRYSAAGLPTGLAIDAATGLISGTLAHNASSAAAGGVYTVIVTASDGRGGSASQGFTLTAANPAPTAGNDSVVAFEDTPASGNVLVNDTDPDGDALTVGTTPVVAPAHGSLVLNADGSYVYTPDANFAGSDSFTYRVTDADGGNTTAVVSLNVAAVNDAPTSTPLDARSNTVGTPVSVGTAANFSDADGDTLVFAATGLPPGLTIDAATGLISGSVLSAGTYSVTVSATDTGGLATRQSFTWTAGAAANNSPNSAATLAAANANDGAAVLLATAQGFSDADGDTLSYSAAGLPPGLRIDVLSGVISGTLPANASSAAAGGVYTVIVSAADGRGGSTSQGFSFTAANPTPLAGNDAAVGSEDRAISGNVLANDVDPDGDAITLDTTPVLAPQHGTLVLNADGSFVYTPDANYVGSDSFTYRVTDADGGASLAVVNLTLTAVNDAPVSSPFAARSNTVGNPVSVPTAGNFSDVDGDTLVFSATGLPPGLSLDPASGVISGTLTTTGTYSVTLSATDPSGATTAQSFTWTAAAAPNNAPVAVGALAAGNANNGTPVLLSTAGGFQDPDGDTLTYAAAGLPPGLSIDPATGVITGALANDAASAVAGGVYTIVVTASDGRGGSASQGFSFTAVNPAPAAVTEVAVGTAERVVSGTVPLVVASEPAPNTADAQASGAPDGTLEVRNFETIRNQATEVVLLDAVNAVKRLDGMGNLAENSPLLAAVGALRELGGHADLTNNAAPMAQVVGDMNSQFKAPLRLEEMASNPYGAAAGLFTNPITAATATAGAADTGLTPADFAPAPQGDSIGTPLPTAPGGTAVPLDTALQASEVNSAALRPTTLSEQLRAASLRSHDEIEALAGALT